MTTFWEFLGKMFEIGAHDGADHIHDYLPRKTKCLICKKPRVLDVVDAPLQAHELLPYAVDVMSKGQAYAEAKLEKRQVVTHDDGAITAHHRTKPWLEIKKKAHQS